MRVDYHRQWDFEDTRNLPKRASDWFEANADFVMIWLCLFAFLGLVVWGVFN